MSIEMELYGYLQLNLPQYSVWYGKVDAEDGNKTISMLRLPGSVVLDSPVKEVNYQISCRAREIDDARTMVDDVVELLRGWYGKLDNTSMRVLSIRDLGDLYEEEAKLVHIPIQVITQIVN